MLYVKKNERLNQEISVVLFRLSETGQVLTADDFALSSPQAERGDSSLREYHLKMLKYSFH